MLVLGRCYLVCKHKITGELLGPFASFEVPTAVVWARWTAQGWIEI